LPVALRFFGLGVPPSPFQACPPGLASLAIAASPDTTPQERPYTSLSVYDPAVDLGIGYLRPTDDARASWSWTDSVALPLFRQAGGDPYAWIVRGWVVSSGGDEVTPLEVEARVETDYENASFVVLRAPEADGWTRIRYATGDSGIAWTHACFFSRGPAALEVVRWEDRFMSPDVSPLYFRFPGPHALQASPGENGARLQAIDGRAGGYALHPLEVAGDWMRVEAVVPSDYCAEADAPPATRTEGWIRWRDDAVGPRVWYFTRGC
jgi:hypothetical protein